MLNTALSCAPRSACLLEFLQPPYPITHSDLENGGEEGGPNKTSLIWHRAFVEALGFAGLVFQELALWNEVACILGQYGFILLFPGACEIVWPVQPASAPYDGLFGLVAEQGHTSKAI